MRKFKPGDIVVATKSCHHYGGGENRERPGYLFVEGQQYKVISVKDQEENRGLQWLGFICDYPYNPAIALGQANFGSMDFEVVAPAITRNLPAWW